MTDIPNFPDFLNTGDSDAIRKDLLDKTIKYLVTQHGFKNVKPVEDRVGHFAQVMRDQYAQRFYLVAKGSKLYRNLISCQAYLPNIAIQERSPLILVWFNPDTKTVRFYLFDPESIIRLVKEHPERYGFNPRQGVQMINFSLQLGIAYDPAMSVEAVWKKIRGTGTQTKLG